MNDSPCQHLPGRLGAICRGDADITPALRRQYIERWLVTGRLVEDPDCREGVSEPAAPPPPPSRPAGGPGTELTKLLDAIGLEMPPGCPCAERAATMDTWGSAGCRTHRAIIVGWLEEAAKEVRWLAKLKAAGRAATGGQIINPLDPAGWLVDEAIHRAELLGF